MRLSASDRAPVEVSAWTKATTAGFARRIDGFLSPEIDPTTQIGYATNAIREGGFLGVGVGEGQVKWSLPDAHTDFIIAVAAEEYGLVLVAFIIPAFRFRLETEGYQRERWDLLTELMLTHSMAWFLVLSPWIVLQILRLAARGWRAAGRSSSASPGSTASSVSW